MFKTYRRKQTTFRPKKRYASVVEHKESKSSELLPEIRNRASDRSIEEGHGYELMPARKYSTLIQAVNEEPESNRSNRVTVFQRNNLYEEVSHDQTNKLYLVKKKEFFKTPQRTRNGNKGVIRTDGKQLKR